MVNVVVGTTSGYVADGGSRATGGPVRGRMAYWAEVAGMTAMKRPKAEQSGSRCRRDQSETGDGCRESAGASGRNGFVELE